MNRSMDGINYINRKRTKKIRIGNIYTGGDAPVTVQSMTNTDTRDVYSTVEQIKRLEEAGCDIIRLAIPDMEAAEALKKIKKSVSIPVVADIHFDYRLALESMKSGADKIRINPGNIGGRDRIEQVVRMAKDMDIPIRIGVNSGSVEKDILARYGRVTAEAMVESALNNAAMLEEYGYDKIVFSIKASSVPITIAAYRLLAQKSTYPLHVGVTEAGTYFSGTIKSAIGIGSLLAEGIGDTLRVSLTGDPVEEVKAGREILKALELDDRGIKFISCPTCGRCRIDLVSIATKLEQKLQGVNKNIKVAVMGCAVNGPGEAREADIGIAGGNGEVLLFKKGKIIRKIPEEKAVEELLNEIQNNLIV